MTSYYSDNRILIRSMIPQDAKILYDTYLSYGWHPSLETYERYYEEQEAGKRLVFIAEYDGRVSGQCTLILKPTDGPWGGQDHPEIVDLTVFFDVHNKGIGSKLLDAVEKEAAKISDKVYLAVGVHSGYGPAQRMYVKRGYNFDGSGVWYQGKQLDQYAPCVNDDDLLLYMSKELEFCGSRSPQVIPAVKDVTEKTGKAETTDDPVKTEETKMTDKSDRKPKSRFFIEHVDYGRNIHIAGAHISGGMRIISLKYRKDDEPPMWVQIDENYRTPEFYLSDTDQFERHINFDSFDDKEEVKKLNENMIDAFERIDVSAWYEGILFEIFGFHYDNPAKPLMRYLMYLASRSDEDMAAAIEFGTGKYADELNIPATEDEEAFFRYMGDRFKL